MNLVESQIEDQAYQAAVATCIKASQTVLKYWPNPGNVRLNSKLVYEVFEKAEGVGNYATTADRKSGEVIRKTLRSYPLLKDHNILSEEFPEEDHGSPYTWIADEVDGTISFNNGSIIFATAIGLIKDGQPIMGAVALPALRQVITGRRGHGAYLMSFTGRTLADLKTFPGNRDLCPDNRLFIGYDLGYENRAGQLTNLVAPIADRVNNVASYSSSIFENAMMAQGAFRATFFEKLILPDMAAVVPILEETGCVVTTLEGQPLDLTQPDSSFLGARSQAIHRRVVELLNN